MNNLKTYTVTVTRIDNSKDTFKMTGTSRRNIFKQLNDRIRQGEAFRNSIVTEIAEFQYLRL